MASPFIVGRILQKTLSGRMAALKSLSKRPHFLPLDIEILHNTLTPFIEEGFSVESIRDTVIEYCSHKGYKKIFSRGGNLYSEAGNKLFGTNIGMYTPALVYSGTHIKGVLVAGNKDNFYNIQRNIFTPLLNDILAPILQSNAGKVKRPSDRGFDLGHLYSSKSNKSLFASPLSEQLNSLDNKIQSLTLTKAEEIALVSELHGKISAIRTEVGEDFSYASDIEGHYELEKTFSESLNSIKCNIVIIQEARDNRLAGEIEAKIQREISKLLLDINFSRNLKEEITFKISEALKGRSVTKTSKKIKGEVIKVVSEKAKPTKSTAILAPELKRTKKNLPNLTSLQALLNRHLQHVISANMGMGSDKLILNYRTGRFASSARVERLSMSRAGMVTAFYTYMKYPYATFSEGGRQQYPRSRDPKKLISGSIREIAAAAAVDRLRAVLV